jgi:transposase InsO family protein
LLEEKSIQVSMDRKGCWRDNVFVERIWKSVKYEEIYLHGYDTVFDVTLSIFTVQVINLQMTLPSACAA